MKSNGNKQKIDQYTLAGEFVRSWESIQDASKSFKISKTCLSRCVRGISKHSKGYVWKYHKYEDLPGELWKQYKNTKIQGSNMGRLKGSRGNILVATNIGGYLRIRTSGVSTAVHRIIAYIWCSNPDNKPEVNHINHEKLDNRACNLEWTTHKENVHAAEKYYNIPEKEKN